ncbi:hypothetical protein [Reyranella sp. CPCC 100927]|uniref:hypothetical protein n=1 Tax=Reyranella sp. CPCC 100927 TaxID=2599616 RepID=UPI0011B59FDD|nr:hypothetical protein [Reyranella sp. CPCC 100927]TWT05042.1 hypothetical protein FQU96_25665 [Reyranella sp. CPCC 100927]
MSRGKIAAIVAGGIAAVLVIAFLVYRMVVQEAGPAFDQSFNESFLDNCLKSARGALTQQGKTGPDAEALVQRYCTCALDVVKPMPAADKILLGNSEAKQREVMAEVQKRCR